MPVNGSQCFLCDLPIRFDTYSGCSHACKYCFAKKFVDISKIERGESPEVLKLFIQGKRTKINNWCDWDIPIHWGGMSDPFQPCEKIHKISLECLKIFAETQYPFVVSTKGKIILENEYLELISKCNCVVQISMVCDKYDKLEEGAPSFEQRLKMLKILSKSVKRTIVRIQPYMHEVFKDVYENLKRFKEAGAYGIIIEGLKFKKVKKGLVKVGGDVTYPYEVILKDFLGFKDEAHRLGLKIYAGENRIRKYGDSLTCCGIDGLDGFKPNTYNLNHLINGEMGAPTKAMCQVGSADCFASLFQNSVFHHYLQTKSFKDYMIEFYKQKKKFVNEIMGVNKQ